MSVKARYVTDPTDQLRALVVQPWAVHDKHPLLERYVRVTAAVRRRFRKEYGRPCGYVELFAGPGRVHLEQPYSFQDGSALRALAASGIGIRSPFDQILLADADADSVQALRARLTARKLDAQTEVGLAEHTVDAAVKMLDPNGFHIAFLDPFSLTPLPFEIILKLARFKHMDLLIHFSAMHVTRSLNNFIDGTESGLDAFAPGWRDRVDLRQEKYRIRHAILDYWLQLVSDTGLKTFRDDLQAVTDEHSRLKYWIALASRHPKAQELWGKIRPPPPQYGLDL